MRVAPWRRSFAALAGCRSPVGASITKKLEDGLQPAQLTVINESHKHAGHSGNPTGDPSAETHFRVSVVSSSFEGLKPIQRHRKVYGLLAHELENGVHALALVGLQTPAEAQKQQQQQQ